MGGPRVSLVLHDGNRITDRKPLAKAFHDKTAMEITRALYGPAVETKSYANLGEEVVAIGGLKKDDKAQTGFQLYLAIEVDGKVVEMGLPFVPGQQGEAFLNPANIRPGDIDSLLRNMPSNAEILLVWRLDRGMTQDITLSGDSLISSMDPSHGNDYSLLDKKPCISCGMGAASRIDLVADISEIRLFCGDRDNPISMGTLLVAPPESFSLDSWNPQAPAPSPLVQVQQPAALRPDNAPGPSQAPIFMHADFVVRLSWEDSLRPSETAPPLLLQSAFCPEAIAGRQDAAPAAANVSPKASTAALVLAICSSKEPACRAEAPPAPAQPSPANRLITLIMNPAELRVWSEIYKRPAQAEPARQARHQPSTPVMAAPIQKPAIGKSTYGPYQLQQENIVKTAPLAPPPADIGPSPKMRQHVLVVGIKKMDPQPRAPTLGDPGPQAQKKPGRRRPKPVMAVQSEKRKKGAMEPPAAQKPPPHKGAERKPPKALRQHCEEPKQAPEAKAPMPAANAKTRTATANPGPRAKPAPEPHARTRRSSSHAKKKDIRPHSLNCLLGLYRNSRGRKFRMKKNRAV